MSSNCISFKDTGFFSPLICNYLEQKKELESFYSHFPSIEALQLQIKEKQKFPIKNRKVLVEVLNTQYADIKTSEATQSNIKNLSSENTFTITTGHQLNLFTGPLYFLYKIISTINLCEKASSKYPLYNFVPIYWMASEDHDFLEINHFQFKGKKIAWNYEKGITNSNGFVGDFPTESLIEVFNVFEKELGLGENATYLKQLFKKSYLKNPDLASATRYIVNELFGKYGLVIIDANHKKLKQLFIPSIEKELTEHVSFRAATITTERLEKKGYNAQVNPREINLFYAKKGLRARIEKNNESYKVVDSDIKWDSFESLKKEVASFPERFSPNVILRPVYQETILPNLCYIGGGGELAYWFQLKDTFKGFGIPFPILLLRNSALIISEKQQKKLKKLKVTPQELFMKRPSLINYKVRQISDIEINFSPQKKMLKQQFEALKDLAKKTDVTFLNAVNAQETKQLKGLQKLEKRLLKAQRIKLSDHVNRLTEIQAILFPQESLQERKNNFSEFYLEYGENFIPELKNKLKPLKNEFDILFFEFL